MKIKLVIVLAIALCLVAGSCASRRCDCSEWSYQFTIEQSDEA